MSHQLPIHLQALGQEAVSSRADTLRTATAPAARSARQLACSDDVRGVPDRAPLYSIRVVRLASPGAAPLSMHLLLPTLVTVGRRGDICAQAATSGNRRKPS